MATHVWWQPPSINKCNQVHSYISDSRTPSLPYRVYLSCAMITISETMSEYMLSGPLHFKQNSCLTKYLMVFKTDFRNLGCRFQPPQREARLSSISVCSIGRVQSLWWAITTCKLKDLYNFKIHTQEARWKTRKKCLDYIHFFVTL